MTTGLYVQKDVAEREKETAVNVHARSMGRVEPFRAGLPDVKRSRQ